MRTLLSDMLNQLERAERIRNEIDKIERFNQINRTFSSIKYSAEVRWTHNYLQILDTETRLQDMMRYTKAPCEKYANVNLSTFTHDHQYNVLAPYPTRALTNHCSVPKEEGKSRWKVSVIKQDGSDCLKIQMPDRTIYSDVGSHTVSNNFYIKSPNLPSP